LRLAEGRQRIYVARQMGHSLAVLLSTYAHLIDEYVKLERIDANADIVAAREHNVRQEFGRSRQPYLGSDRVGNREERPCRPFLSIPLPGFEPG
jgi:hypothetical protein